MAKPRRKKKEMMAACDTLNRRTHRSGCLEGLYLWLIAVGDHFEYTPLQVFHIGNAQSGQNRADAFREKTYWNMNRELHWCSSV